MFGDSCSFEVPCVTFFIISKSCKILSRGLQFVSVKLPKIYATGYTTEFSLGGPVSVSLHYQVGHCQ